MVLFIVVESNALYCKQLFWRLPVHFTAKFLVVPDEYVNNDWGLMKSPSLMDHERLIDNSKLMNMQLLLGLVNIQMKTQEVYLSI